MAPLITVSLVSYFIGGIPWGVILGKLQGIDIRDHGSGNVGATNISRVLGKKWGIVCFFFDAAKGFLPVFVAMMLSKSRTMPDADYFAVCALIGVVAGHVWSPYLKFTGGKGVATAAGGLLAITPTAIVLAVVFWYIVFLVSRYVSLASIAAALFYPLCALAIDRMHTTPAQTIGRPAMMAIVILAALVIVKHRANIHRLLNGTELKFQKNTKCSQGG